MRIVTLDSNQMRMWYRNRPVLVDNETGESVLVDGKPKHPNRDEMLQLLRAVKRRTLFDVEFDGKKCHYVNGREFLCRVFMRAYNQPVQLRTPNGQVLGRAKPKFLGHDIAKSECKPIDSRPYKQERSEVPAHLLSRHQNIANPVPPPESCPECSTYAKPLGCRQDEHHFVCRHHDAWESIRAEMLLKRARQLKEAFNQKHGCKTVEQSPIEETPKTEEPEQVFMVVNLDDGAQLRTASEEEVAQAKTLVETGELPIIDIGGLPYAIVDTDMAFPESLTELIGR